MTVVRREISKAFFRKQKIHGGLKRFFCGTRRFLRLPTVLKNAYADLCGGFCLKIILGR